MNSTFFHENVGRIFVPEAERVSFGPAGRVKPKHIAVVSFSVRSPGGKKTQASWALGIIPYDGWKERIKTEEDLARQFKNVDAMSEAFSRQMRLAAYSAFHNERVDNGSKALAKGFWGIASSPGYATVNPPTLMALATTGMTAAAHGDNSLGTATQDVTTNEYTNDGLARTASLTPAGWTAASALDGQFQFTLSNVYTDTTAGNTVNGTGLFDNTVANTHSNMFAEALPTAAILSVADQLTPTWTIKG